MCVWLCLCLAHSIGVHVWVAGAARRATELLRGKLVPAFARELSDGRVLLAHASQLSDLMHARGECEGLSGTPPPPLPWTTNVRVWLPLAGINMRYLGAVLRHLEELRFKRSGMAMHGESFAARSANAVLVELVSRIVKNDVRFALRRVPSVDDTPHRRVIVAFLNIVLGERVATRTFWLLHLPIALRQKYGSIAANMVRRRRRCVGGAGVPRLTVVVREQVAEASNKFAKQHNGKIPCCCCCCCCWMTNQCKCASSCVLQLT